MQEKSLRKLVVFLVYPNFKLLDLAGPLQAFNDALDINGNPAYETVILSADGSTMVSDTLVCVSTESVSNCSNRCIDTIIVAGGRGARAACQDDKLLTAIRALTKQSRRVASVCNGAFILAASGLLKDRRAVTHWEVCEELAAFSPDTQVDANPIFIKDGNTWTSAGVTAGLDMALAMISEDIGNSAALKLARSLVAYMVRPGGQAQFSEVLKLQSADGEGRFDKLHQWIRNNLDRELKVTTLANQALMSPRNFARIYVSETKQTPARAVEMLRIEAARLELEEARLGIKAIARRCGFGSEESMRRSFLKQLRITPSEYKSRFSRTSKA